MALFVNIFFLGSALTIMLVYVWSRRNPFVRMNFFGLLNFQAPYLPWVLLAFSLLLGNSIIVDLMGIIVGHIYYFLEDIFPRQQGGFKILRTPRFLYEPLVSLSLSQIRITVLSLDIGYSMKIEHEMKTMIHVQTLRTKCRLVPVVFIGSSIGMCCASFFTDGFFLVHLDSENKAAADESMTFAGDEQVERRLLSASLSN